MKIAYFCCSVDHLPLGEISAASARACMPDAEIIHLTDRDTPALQGADRVIRLELDGSFWRRLWLASSHLDGEVIHANTDIVFLQDVSSVFTLDFDIAVPHIADPRWRYDAGLLFSRSRDFCRALAESSAAGTNDLDAWLASYRIAVDRFAHVTLPGYFYSHVPLRDKVSDERIKVMHFRGPRKAWMLASWKPSPDDERWMPKH